MGLEMDVDTHQLDVKQLFFNNLQLLGFDAPAMEAANHIPFNKTMFELPNKRGSEIVLHFLFQRLNPTMCREAFRDCWPIFDKKREQAFRKACSNWLANISQDEPESHLPRINASLFMSPGGEKFYQMLFHFSGHVLQKVLDLELGSESCDRLRYPLPNAQNLSMLNVINKNLACCAIRQRTKYFEAVQLNVKANKVWKDSADEHVREYRKLNKEIRECEYKLREEEQRGVEASMARGSPARKRQQDDSYGVDPRTIKRAQRIQQVREMWEQLDSYDRLAAPEREVVESIVERTVNKYKLDGDEISVKVPDMLLRECGEEIRRRNVDNTYQGGKLNLLSVLQLWNLALQLYMEKFREVGMPKYEEEVKMLTSQVHVQQNYSQKAQTLRHHMAERIPVLKESVAKLREKLDAVLFKDMSPESIRTTSIGLGLVGPSPQPSFSPGKGKTPDGGIGVPRTANSYVETPEAANQITERMREAVRCGPEQLFRQPDLLKQTNRPHEPSSIPKPARSQTSSRASSRPTSAKSNASVKSSVKSTPKSSKSANRLETNRSGHKSSTKVTSPKSVMERLQLGDSLRQEADGQEEETGLPPSQPMSARSDQSNASTSRTLTDRSNKSTSSRGNVHGDQKFGGALGKTTADLLVEEIMGEGQILSPFNSGMEAFETHSLVKRTPDMTGNDSRESITPTEDIIDVHSAEVDMDKYIENYQTSHNSFLETESRNIEEDLSGRVRQSGISPLYSEDPSIDPGSEDPDRYARVGIMKRLSERRDTEGSREDDVEKMIEEGIRQVHEEELLEENENEVNLIDKENRLYEEEGDEVQFDEVHGPDIEDDEDDNVSQRSAEQPIVIDRSVHMSPAHTERLQQMSPPLSPETLLEEEKFPSLENSPREAIVIDHSFLTPGTKGVMSPVLSPAMGYGKGVERMLSPGDLINKKLQKPGPPADVLSRSLQGRPSPADKTAGRDFMSRSLILERSPLSDEIRKMFQKALQDTPLNKQTKSSPRVYVERNGENSPEFPGQVLKQSDISWDLTENLEDIEIPNLDEDMEDDDDDNIDDLLQEEDRLPNLQTVNVDDLLNDERNAQIPGLDDKSEIDDFFKSKTPELPKRRMPVSDIDRSGSRDEIQRSFEESSGLDFPSFPQARGKENESPLISFTP